MRHRILTGTTALGVLAATLAATTNAQESDYAAVEQAMRELAPSAETIAVSETPIEGVLQVQINGEIVYASSDGRYLIQGRIVDLESRNDLTEQAKTVQRKALMGDIDPTKQIAFEPEDPDYELIVFTDIDCGYCRKLHAQMAEYNEQGIGIRYMSFPRAGIGSNSYNKAVSVWCAADQQSAMTNAKLGNDPEPLQCDNPIAEQYDIGRRLGVTGTPALLMGDGQLIPGYVPPDKLRARLDQLAADTTAAE